MSMSRSLVRELVHLGWPVLIAQLAVMANNVIDTIMAGRYGTLDLAAVGIGSEHLLSVFVSLMGVLLALTPIVAHFTAPVATPRSGRNCARAPGSPLRWRWSRSSLFAYPEPFLAVAGWNPIWKSGCAPICTRSHGRCRRRSCSACSTAFQPRSRGRAR